MRDGVEARLTDLRIEAVRVGKRFTLAGRYVYAAPPGSTFPASGINRSNQTA